MLACTVRSNKGVLHIVTYVLAKEVQLIIVDNKNITLLKVHHDIQYVKT